MSLMCFFAIFTAFYCQLVIGHKFTHQQLLANTFPHRTSSDLDLDPCKADLHQGDIAVPKEEELDKIRKEVFLEGLQVEEEGLSPAQRKRLLRPRTGATPRPETRKRRAATARKDRVWEYGVIPYEIDGNFSGAHKALFKQAMRHWENFTCVKFVERVPSEHPNFIVFTERPCGCCSFVGKRGNGPQAISIGKNCDKFGIVVHELGHVVGFWHEHTRPDRDNHVLIVRDNIMTGQEYNFNKLTEEEVNSLGLPYDYDSIMHYARNTFSKGTYLDTIQPTDYGKSKRRPEIGQRLRLSEGDIAQTNLLYKCLRCGRTYQDNSGTIISPTSKLHENEKCEWRIMATHGERIVLNITDIDLYKSENCRTDYLEVRDGYWHKSKLLGKFCGSRIPDLIVSSGSRMLLSFATSLKSNGHKGFSAHYEAVCGGNIDVEEVGHLESPNYPEDYQHNKECIWKLTAPKDYQVAIKFHSFEVEKHDNCFYDYVEILDGHDPDSPVIGKYCGYKLPPDVHSTGNQLLIKFVSDGSVQKAGFSAAYMKEYDECSLLDHGCEQQCVNTLGGYECACKIGFELHSDNKHCEDACGGTLDAPSGTITSPSFPDLYPGDKTCVWEIIAPPQYRITLNFTHFDLEGNNVFQQECEYDSIEVHSKLSADVLHRHGVYCGSKLPPLITSEANALRIEFSSDSSIHKTGFAAMFFTDMDECAVDNGGCQHECRNTLGSYACWCHNGYTLHDNGHDCKEGGCKHEVRAPAGTVSSPNYPEYYPSRKECVWQFTTTPGHRIRLTFSEFELEPHQECEYDHVALYDGDSADAMTLGTFCGSKLPHPIIATSNHMYMIFKSDASVQRKGFLALHSTACGGRLSATSRVKHLYSHSKYGDHNYDNRADCDWTIEAEPGQLIHLTFLTFELEDEPHCMYDYVEVFSGPDTSGPSYGNFCGNTNPTQILSVTESLLVRFRSDDTVVSKGFSASYVAIDQISGELMSTEDSIDLLWDQPLVREAAFEWNTCEISASTSVFDISHTQSEDRDHSIMSELAFESRQSTSSCTSTVIDEVGDRTAIFHAVPTQESIASDASGHWEHKEHSPVTMKKYRKSRASLNNSQKKTKNVIFASESQLNSTCNASDSSSYISDSSSNHDSLLSREVELKKINNNVSANNSIDNSNHAIHIDMPVIQEEGEKKNTYKKNKKLEKETLLKKTRGPAKTKSKGTQVNVKTRATKAVNTNAKPRRQRRQKKNENGNKKQENIQENTKDNDQIDNENGENSIAVDNNYNINLAYIPDANIEKVSKEKLREKRVGTLLQTPSTSQIVPSIDDTSLNLHELSLNSSFATSDNSQEISHSNSCSIKIEKDPTTNSKKISIVLPAKTAISVNKNKVSTIQNKTTVCEQIEVKNEKASPKTIDLTLDTDHVKIKQEKGDKTVDLETYSKRSDKLHKKRSKLYKSPPIQRNHNLKNRSSSTNSTDSSEDSEASSCSHSWSGSCSCDSEDSCSCSYCNDSSSCSCSDCCIESPYDKYRYRKRSRR